MIRAADGDAPVLMTLHPHKLQVVAGSATVKLQVNGGMGSCAATISCITNLITSSFTTPPSLARLLSHHQCSCVTRITSHVTHMPYNTRYTSHVTHHTSHITRHTSHVTRHTSHITRHTSHVTRHTSHITRHTSHVTHTYATSQTASLQQYTH